MPGLPGGKPAGQRCPHLDARLRCRLFGSPERPDVCRSLRPNAEMCGPNAAYAFAYLEELERVTRPG